MVADRLTVEDLRKDYGDRTVLRGVHFGLIAGEVVALLGKNGAGKSTTMKILVGLIEPDEGRATFAGSAPKDAIRAGTVGYCPQDVAVYPTLTVEHNLRFFGRTFGERPDLEDRLRQVADGLGLTDHLGTRAGKLSGGEKRRVHLAATLLSDAPILLLDEPSAGVDVGSRELLIESVRREAAVGRAVLLCSHDLAEVERVADRVLILHEGTILASGTLAELAATLGDLVSFEFESPHERDTARAMLSHLGPRSRGAAGLDIYVDGTTGIDALVAHCTGSGLRVRRLELIPAGLEAVFMKLTAEEAPRDSTNPLDVQP